MAALAGVKTGLKKFRDALPEGGSLPQEVWFRRHRAIVFLVWAHVVGLFLYGTATGHGMGHSALEAGFVAACGVVASIGSIRRNLRALAAVLGLITSSAILVHFSGGMIELHFHFFVMVGVISLYQDWQPFLMAIGFVVLHHGTAGILQPESVYNHPAAWANPWKWAAIHGTFILGMSIASVAAWRVNEQGFRDPLTKLPNRSLFHDRTQHAILRTQRERGSLSGLIIDLDGFKTVNDSLGHAAGDALIVEAGRRLTKSLRASDTAARLGGDEFAMLLEATDEDGAKMVADRVIAALHQPFFVGGREVFVGASVGIATTDGRCDAAELLRDADVAMYVAKTNGKGRYEVFAPQMHEAAMKRLNLYGELKHALTDHEFNVVYQPIVDLKSGTAIGAEALLRWHSANGLVSPADFIPLAEETGLIIPIGRWVLEEACREAATWQQPGQPPVKVSINISGRQLQDRDVVDHVAAALQHSGLPASCLQLEVTESFLMDDVDVACARLHELKSLGITIAIDDFGTGYSSLSHLQRLPVDVLKIDKAFVDHVTEGAEESALAKSIVKIGGALELSIVAEGIEENDQARVLEAMGCQQGQGYCFSRPIEGTAFRKMLRPLPRKTRAIRAARIAAVADPAPAKSKAV